LDAIQLLAKFQLSKNWCKFMKFQESFCMFKAMWTLFFNCFVPCFTKLKKYEHVFCYSNLHQMFLNLLWTLIHLIIRAIYVQPHFKSLL
jgi:uncharacterized membrane protein